MAAFEIATSRDIEAIADLNIHKSPLTPRFLALPRNAASEALPPVLHSLLKARNEKLISPPNRHCTQPFTSQLTNGRWG